MNKFVLLMVIICLSKTVVANTIQENHVFKVDDAEWTNEDLEKARQIIDYFKNHETQSVESQAMDTGRANSKYDESRDHDTAIDSWSIVWYVASFGGLIIFFLVVSCSEWCCKRQNNQQAAVMSGLTAQMGVQQQSSSVVESPPPSYDLFAPPSYESLATFGNGNEKNLYDIYVVPIHTITPTVLNDEPPQYTTISISHNSQDITAHSHA